VTKLQDSRDHFRFNHVRRLAKKMKAHWEESEKRRHN